MLPGVGSAAVWRAKTELAEDSDDGAETQREIEEGVLDLIARDTSSSAVERASEVASELEEVAA